MSKNSSFGNIFGTFKPGVSISPIRLSKQLKAI
jgi:hypothetical protein